MQQCPSRGISGVTAAQRFLQEEKWLLVLIKKREENATADFRCPKLGSRVRNCLQSILMEGCRANCTARKAFPQFCLVFFPRGIFARRILCPVTEADTVKVGDGHHNFLLLPIQTPFISMSSHSTCLPACLRSPRFRSSI